MTSAQQKLCRKRAAIINRFIFDAGRNKKERYILRVLRNNGYDVQIAEQPCEKNLRSVIYVKAPGAKVYQYLASTHPAPDYDADVLFDCLLFLAEKYYQMQFPLCTSLKRLLVSKAAFYAWITNAVGIDVRVLPLQGGGKEVHYKSAADWKRSTTMHKTFMFHSSGKTLTTTKEIYASILRREAFVAISRLEKRMKEIQDSKTPKPILQ
jgi:hypothetical protein